MVAQFQALTSSLHTYGTYIMDLSQHVAYFIITPAYGTA